MAYKLVFQQPYLDMPHIWNVSDSVGDHSTCKNNPTDVDLVTLLLRSFINLYPTIGANLHASCKQSLQVNGQMDINKAYWIRFFSETQYDQGKLSLKDSGMVSRARKSHYSDGTWMIVKLNRALFQKNKVTWAELPNQSADVPQALARELLTKTSP